MICDNYQVKYDFDYVYVWCGTMCSLTWLSVSMIDNSDVFRYILDVDVWFFLIYYMSLVMNYVDVSIGMNNVTFRCIGFPNVLLKWYHTCDKMMMRVSCCGTPTSTWYMKNINMSLDLVG